MSISDDSLHLLNEMLYSYRYFPCIVPRLPEAPGGHAMPGQRTGNTEKRHAGSGHFMRSLTSVERIGISRSEDPGREGYPYGYGKTDTNSCETDIQAPAI